MIQNLLCVTAYNVIAIPAAAGLFIRWKVNLPMSVGALAKKGSTAGVLYFVGVPDRI